MNIIDNGIFKIENKENFSIKILNRNLFTYYNHLIYEICDKIDCFFDTSKLKIELMNEDNISKCSNSDFDPKYILKLKKKYPNKFVGIILMTEKGDICGYICGLYPKSKEIQYRIEYIDFFVKYVYIYPKYRGKRLVQVLFCRLFETIDKEKIFLAVRKNNMAAIKAYEKIGGKAVSKKKFIRILKLNLPYYKI